MLADQCCLNQPAQLAERRILSQDDTQGQYRAVQ